VSRRGRCLLVECLAYHWEVLPAWVGLLQRLGWDVEVAGSGDAAGHHETLALLQSRCRTHQVGELQNLRLDDFDFVVLNSLVHEGFSFDCPPDPKPNLAWIDDLGLPSISIVHEPVHWVEKRLIRSLREVGERGRQVKLLADGCLQYDNGHWRGRWSMDGDRLGISEDGRTRVFESPDGGRSFRSLEGNCTTTLLQRDIPVEDLSRHCADGRHAVITLTEAGAAHLATVHRGVEWILPFEIRDRLPARAAGEIAFAGAIDYDRKRIPSILQGCEALREDEYIRIIGGSRNTDFDGNGFVRFFKSEVAERGLSSKFRFTGYLPYGEFVERIRRCRFLLPLVDDHVDSGSYLTKLPASIACSLSFGIPLIVNRLIAEKFDLQYMICYPDDDLASGLNAAQQLSAGDYAAMLETLDRHAEALDQRNMNVFAGLIERITG
jgi:hypothetical protein